MTGAYYFWKDGEVITEQWWVTMGAAITKELTGLPCVDTSAIDTRMRYGQFTRRGWQSIPLPYFPKEFRAHLLLLGVA